MTAHELCCLVVIAYVEHAVDRVYSISCVFKVNETLLRSIVTQPWRDNYVYARTFESLSFVKKLLLSQTCRYYVTSSTTSTIPTTAVHPTEPSVTPPYNGSYNKNKLAFTI